MLDSVVSGNPTLADPWNFERPPPVLHLDLLNIFLFQLVALC